MWWYAGLKKSVYFLLFLFIFQYVILLIIKSLFKLTLYYNAVASFLQNTMVCFVVINKRIKNDKFK